MEHFRLASSYLTRRQALALFSLGAVTAIVAACSSAAPAATRTAAPAAAAPAAPAAPTATTAPAAPTPAPGPDFDDRASPHDRSNRGAHADDGAWPAAAAPSSGGVVEVLYGIHDDPKARQETLDAFNQANTGKVHVTIQMIQDFPTKIPTMAAAGTLPDVVRMWEAMVRDMALGLEQVIPLDDKIKAQTDFNPDDFFKVFWDYPVVDGKRYGIADVGAPHFNFYNRDLFASRAFRCKPDAAWTWTTTSPTRRRSANQLRIWGSDTIPSAGNIGRSSSCGKPGAIGTTRITPNVRSTCPS